jgi:hypothetical protein
MYQGGGTTPPWWKAVASRTDATLSQPVVLAGDLSAEGSVTVAAVVER